jgi:hypothetical protein
MESWGAHIYLKYIHIYIVQYGEQFLRRESAASRFLGLQVLIPRVLGCLSLGNVSGQVEASTSG